MKFYIKILYLLISTSILTYLVSCEDLVEVNTPNNQIISDQVFEDVQTANAALAGLYAGLWDRSPLNGGIHGMGAVFGTYTDDLDCYQSSILNGNFDLYLNQQGDTNTTVYGTWQSAYQYIYIANAIIEGAENSVALPEHERSRIKGEALLARSVLFFYLQQFFGDIPFTVSTDYTINQDLGKTNATEVLNFLVRDLTESATLLSDEYRTGERIHPNRKVAQLILAKVLMLQQRWGEAETILESILQSPSYQFEDDVTSVFLNTGQHILWQLKPKNPGDPTKETLLYYFQSSVPANFALSQDLISSFSAEDLRRQNWIATEVVGENTLYRSVKYKNRSNNMTEYSIVFRLEEAYLLMAEALTQQNKIAEALPYLNATRQRANIPLVAEPISREDLLSEILVENRREFFAEMGHRFLDLKRMGRLADLTAVKPNWKDHHQLWPIPQQELLLNPNLSPQNTGY